jgi:hypothetical protein
VWPWLGVGILIICRPLSPGPKERSCAPSAHHLSGCPPRTPGNLRPLAVSRRGHRAPTPRTPRTRRGWRPLSLSALAARVNGRAVASIPGNDQKQGSTTAPQIERSTPRFMASCNASHCFLFCLSIRPSFMRLSLSAEGLFGT